MQFSDYLSAFNVEDLRELAARRGVALSPAALNGRQTLVRSLAAVLARYDTQYSAVLRLNRAEFAVLHHLLHGGRHPSLSALCARTGADPARARAVLESLRLWGLVFPEGDWERIVIPPQTQIVNHYLPHSPGMPEALAAVLFLPPIETAAGIVCELRPGSFGWDLAEFLARVARSRLKLTQAGWMNRRDLKPMDPAFGIRTPGYSTFLYMLAGELDLLAAESTAGILVVPREADAWLAQPEETRAGITAAAWPTLRGYPENMPGNPADYDYISSQLPAQRARMLELLREPDPEVTVTLSSFSERLAWALPLALQQWDSLRDAQLVAARMLRSMYWLGLAALDDPEQPKHARLGPLGARVLRKAESGPPLVPEEPRFFLQPNAEVFAPPNLSPRTLFHLRRLTGEKKGGPAGMYPITAESLRRALDSGITVPQILTFLERFSRTGLPANVRSLVETAGRQHGRIRLIPAGYVLVTDEPALLEELRRVKSVAPLVGPPITERAAALDAERVGEMMRLLRARGYAPLNLAECGEGLPLPEGDPSDPPPPLRREGEAPAEPQEE